MVAGRHQKVPRALRRGGGQDRRLELDEALLDHAAADGGDHPGAQQHVAMNAVPPQVKEAVSQPEVVRIVVLPRDLDRQDIGG